jgi:GDP-mannose 6-dehydrogenase
LGLGYVGAVSAACLAQEGHDVIGELNRASGDLLATLYADMPAPMIRTDINTAEMVKYADNCWHALKVGFANEIGNLCKGVEVDSHRVMDIFCQDTKLNLSPYYLKPGFAFGGSCLPKDLRALLYKAKTLDVSLPILGAILPSNEQQLERAVRAVIEMGSKKVGILGFSFKAGTDDLRESPVVDLTERLIGKGYDLRIYDKNVNLARIHGANRDYILNHIPHISRLMVSSIDEVLDHAKPSSSAIRRRNSATCQGALAKDSPSSIWCASRIHAASPASTRASAGSAPP